MRPGVIFAILAIFSSCYEPAGAFILPDTCDAPPPCLCGANSIYCSDRRLPAVPSFTPTPRSGMLYIYLQNNNIIVLTDNSFHGLNASKYYIDLSGNKLHDIHPTAFNGVAVGVTILKLDDNQLSKLPLALTHLTGLVSLDIRINPLRTFDPTVMQPIGSHLGVLYVGSEAMTAWPNEFRLLTMLNTLHIYKAALTGIPSHAFLPFAKTLAYLVIIRSNLVAVPHAICDLKQLMDLTFIKNQDLNTSMNIIPTCTTPMTNVQSVTFTDNQLESFPDVFHLFPKMLSLSVTGNPELTSMNNTSIPDDTVITTLTLSTNSFQSIPTEVSVLGHLHNLYMESNNITELQSGDLNNNLVRLSLLSNPLSTIGDGAFDNVTSLRLLNLADTGLARIPEEIKNLPALRTLSVGHSITCTCQAMAWMKQWTGWQRMAITGTCARLKQGVKVKDFLLLQLKQCQ